MQKTRRSAHALAFAAIASLLLSCGSDDDQAGPPEVSFSWLSVSQWLVETPVGGMLLDAYVSRPPFSDSGPNEAGLSLYREIVEAVAPDLSIRWIAVGHSHFDHAIDVGALALETGAQVLGSRTTCFIAESQGLPIDRCTAVAGGETIQLDDRLSVSVVRIPHSSPDTIGRFGELDAPPENSLLAPNGGNLAFLFELDTGAASPLSWLYSNSISPIDSDDGSGVDFIQALTTLFDGRDETNLWLGAPFGGAATLGPYFDEIRPLAFVPHHFDGLTPVLTDGVPGVIDDPGLNAELGRRSIELVTPTQYLDRIVLTETATTLDRDLEAKEALGVPFKRNDTSQAISVSGSVRHDSGLGSDAMATRCVH